MQTRKVFFNILIISLMLFRVAFILSAQETIPADDEKSSIVKTGDVAPDKRFEGEKDFVFIPVSRKVKNEKRWK